MNVPKQSLCLIALGLIFLAGCGEPKATPDYFDLGYQDFEKQNWNGAIADYTRAIELDPTDSSAYGLRAIAERRSGKYGTRGWARYGKGDIAGAIEDCKKAIELFKPDSPSVACDQGMLNFINGDYEKAIAAWQKAIEKEATLKLELQPWIEKAQAKLQEKKP